MFSKLKEKWGVSWCRFVLIFITFALGGSLCAKVGSMILESVLPEKNVVYWIVYIPVMTLVWPLCVLLVSIPFGQFGFFVNYLRKMGMRMGIVKSN